MLTASLKQCLHVFQQQAQSKAISLNYQAIMILSLDCVAVTSVNLCPSFSPLLLFFLSLSDSVVLCFL